MKDEEDGEGRKDDERMKGRMKEARDVWWAGSPLVRKDGVWE